MSTSGCSICVLSGASIVYQSGAIIYTGGATLHPFNGLYGTTIKGALSSGSVLSSGAVINESMPILISSGGISIGTTLDENLEQAYVNFINDKFRAMQTGSTGDFNGTATFGGHTQSFTKGYKGSIVDSALMTLNGVAGSIESHGGSARCNINIVPTLGVHGETSEREGDIFTIICKEHGCISCEDYKTLMALEMVLYHALNAIDYRIVKGTTNSPEGLWLQYQGAIACWNRYAFATSYVGYLNAERETLGVQLGWCNPVCTPGGFLAYANVKPNPIIGSGGEIIWTAPQYDRYRIFYLRSLMTTSNSYDNNEPHIDGPIPFIVKHTSGGSLLYMGPGSDENLKNKLIDNIETYGPPTNISSGGLDLSSAVVVSTVQELTYGGLTAGGTTSGGVIIPVTVPEISGGTNSQTFLGDDTTSGGVINTSGAAVGWSGGHTTTTVTNIYTPAQADLWQLGVCTPPDTVGGLGYVIQGFSLGFAPDIAADDAFVISEEEMDRYNVDIRWYDLHTSGAVFGPVHRPTKALKVFSLEKPLEAE